MLQLHLLASFKQPLKMFYKAILDTDVKGRYLPIISKLLPLYLDY